MSREASETIPGAGARSKDAARARRRGPSLLPVLAFVSVWLGGSWIVVGAWLSPVVPGGGWFVLAGLILGAVAVAMLIQGFRKAWYPPAAARVLMFRPFWYAMLFLPLLSAATLGGGLMGLPFGASGAFGRGALGVTGAVLGVAAVAGFLGSRRLVVKRFDVRMARLPPAFDGLRVVQVSDLHVGPHTPKAFLRRVVERVRAEAPDLLAITGDQVDDFSHDVEGFNAAFGDLMAPLGSFAVAGNHDVYAGWPEVHRGLERAGFIVLVNDAVCVEREGQRLWIAGTGDPAAKHWPGAVDSAAPDIGRTLAKVPEGEPVICLAHNPALWPGLAENGVDLTLSGHTHYGQFAIPARNWSMASPFLEHAMGHYRRGGSLLYINPGTNYWGIPFRIGAHPEVTVLTLRKAGDGAAGLEESTD